MHFAAAEFKEVLPCEKFPNVGYSYSLTNGFFHFIFPGRRCGSATSISHLVHEKGSFGGLTKKSLATFALKPQPLM